MESLLDKLVSESCDTTSLRTKVENCLSECPYAFVFRDVTFYIQKNKIVVRGRVPSFQLKQDLEDRLQHLAPVVNRVSVVNAHGLSSVGCD